MTGGFQRCLNISGVVSGFSRASTALTPAAWAPSTERPLGSCMLDGRCTASLCAIEISRRRAGQTDVSGVSLRFPMTSRREGVGDFGQANSGHGDAALAFAFAFAFASASDTVELLLSLQPIRLSARCPRLVLYASHPRTSGLLFDGFMLRARQTASCHASRLLQEPHGRAVASTSLRFLSSSRASAKDHAETPSVAARRPRRGMMYGAQRISLTSVYRARQFYSPWLERKASTESLAE